jgi:hypothetical protein
MDAPSVDSGVHDWLHGRSDAFAASEILMTPLLSARHSEPKGEEWEDLSPDSNPMFQHR